MATRLDLSEFEGRISCFGQFDREDMVCLTHCVLHFECAAAREQGHAQQIIDDSLESLPFPHSA